MVMKRLIVLLVLFSTLLTATTPVFAVNDPLSVPNNKIGIHILFPSELPAAAKLVNSSGGDWGYVTIPIQAGDRNLQKWQAFMDQAKQLHLIPIIRLATEGDYFNTSVWRKPTYADVLDFANFLNSLTWPTQNRYIIIFNEVNRADEWGGQENPQEYADILSYAVTAFKTANPNFFIIAAGMDNAAANTNTSMNEYAFFQGMNEAVPGIFNQIDGVASHSYPNPGFSEPPSIHTSESITSFAYEHSLIESMSNKALPIFITETGWSQNIFSQATIGSYFTEALNTVWNDPTIVAVTPFLLNAGGGPFAQFSFTNPDGSPNLVYQAVYALQKTKGQPLLEQDVLAAKTVDTHLPVESFTKEKNPSLVFSVSQDAKAVLKWFLHI